MSAKVMDTVNGCHTAAAAAVSGSERKETTRVFRDVVVTTADLSSFPV